MISASRRLSFYVWALACLLLLSGSVIAQTAAPDLPDFLRAQAGFTDADFATVETGQSVAKILPSSDRREVAAIGVVRVLPRTDLFLQQYKAELLQPGKTVRQSGILGDPPALADLQTLTLERRDIEDIKNCEVGRCRVKLSAEMIERLRREVDWAAPDYQAQTNLLFRRLLFDYLQAYRQQGNGALITYRDQRQAVPLATELHALIADVKFLNVYAPELAKHLIEFPQSSLTMTDSFIYWAKLKYQLKPVITVTHVSIYMTRRDGAQLTLVAAKQLYADHYFDSSFALTAFITPSSTDHDAYLIYLNRSRADALNGTRRSLVRPIVEREAVSAINKSLDATRESMTLAARNEAVRAAAATNADRTWSPLRYSGFFILCAGLGILLGLLFGKTNEVNKRIFLAATGLGILTLLVAGFHLTGASEARTQQLAIFGTVGLEAAFLLLLRPLLATRDSRTYWLWLLIIVGTLFLPLSFAFGKWFAVLSGLCVLNASFGLVLKAWTVRIFVTIDGLLKLAIGLIVTLATLPA